MSLKINLTFTKIQFYRKGREKITHKYRYIIIYRPFRQGSCQEKIPDRRITNSSIDITSQERILFL